MNTTTLTSGRSLQLNRPRLPDIPGLAGALAGLCGGITMWVVAALLVHVLDLNIWFQPRVIASLVLGSSAVAQTDFALDVVLVGALVHLGISAALGAFFELFMRRIARLPTEFGVPELVGLTYGVMIWLVVYFVAAPLLTPLLLAIYAPALVIQHVVYGAITGLVYGMLRPQPYVITQ